VVCDVVENLARETAAEIEPSGSPVLVLKVDVTSPADTRQMAEASLTRFGRIDILVNNAGITRDRLLLRMEESEWDAVMAVNLKGVYNCTKAVLPTLVKRRQGRIINISSVVGIMGNAGQANYAASKAGVIAFTKSLAKEVGPRGITVNAIAPGFIETAMTAGLSEETRQAYRALIPLGRFGSVDEVAGAVRFLASDDAAYITGHVIQVDGGMRT
jgi:3-oxoacyl-[acyl-carrier protein] reductase